MKRIGVISVTLNAIHPLMQIFSEQTEKYCVKNYLDEGLQELVQKEKKVTDHAFNRMFAIISRAVEDGANGILLTCTVFTPYVERLQKLCPVPIISADGAMLKQVAAANKKTAILCTFPASVQSCTEMYNYYCDKLGTEKNMDVFILEDAAAAIKRGNKKEHDRCIAQKAMALIEDYDLIVLAQLSMAPAAVLLDKCPKPVLTSPSSAVGALNLAFY